MTRDFLKPQKTTGLDTNTPAGQRSRFASRPFSANPRTQQPPLDIQKMRERVARAGSPMAKSWGKSPPAVQPEVMPEEEKEENLQMKQESTIQRQELEEEKLQTKSEPTVQREELPEEEEEENLQMQANESVQRQELEEEEGLQMQPEPSLQRQEMEEE